MLFAAGPLLIAACCGVKSWALAVKDCQWSLQLYEGGWLSARPNGVKAVLELGFKDACTHKQSKEESANNNREI